MEPRLGLAARWLPGAAFLAYLVGTVLLFYFGPWQYQVRHHGRLLAFLAAAHLALAAGYLSGVRAKPRASRWRIAPRTLALLCIGIDLALLLPTSLHNTGSLIPPVWDTLADLGRTYSETLRLQQEKVPYVNYLRILVAPLLAGSLPLGVFYWRSLGWGRFALVVLVVGNLALFVSMGTNKGVGEWAMLYPWFVVAGHLSGVLHLDRRRGAVAAAIGAANFAVFFLFFGATMYLREGSYARDGRIAQIGAVSEIAPLPPRQEPAPPPAEAAAPPPPAPPPQKQEVVEPMAPATPPATPPAAPSPATPEGMVVDAAVTTTVAGFTSYLTQGYYAVYLALDEPFVPMWGIGHSVFLQRQAVRLTGDAAIPERPYPERIEPKGWHATIFWATIYPWIASDVGFPGAVLVVFLIGRLLALTWIDTLGGRNPFAVVLLGQLLLMLYYFPAHNRCLQTGEGVVAFWGVLVLWWVGRRGSA